MGLLKPALSHRRVPHVADCSPGLRRRGGALPVPLGCSRSGGLHVDVKAGLQPSVMICSAPSAGASKPHLIALPQPHL